MVKATRLVIDTKTGKQHTEEYDFAPTPFVPEAVGVDFEKLKAALQRAEIIQSYSEIE